MGSLPDSKYIIQTDGYYFVESHDVDPSKGYISVSAKGIINGLSNIPNDGADFGPDTYNPDYTGSGIPYTQTSGIQEAVNYAFTQYTASPSLPTSIVSPVVKLLDGEFAVNKGISISPKTPSGVYLNGFAIYGVDQMLTYIAVNTTDDLFIVDPNFVGQLTIANIQPYAPTGVNPSSIVSWLSATAQAQTLVIQHLNGSNPGWINGTLYLTNLENIIMIDHERYGTGVNIDSCELVIDIAGTNDLNAWHQATGSSLAISNITNCTAVYLSSAWLGWYDIGGSNSVQIYGNQLQGIVLSGNVDYLTVDATGTYIGTTSSNAPLIYNVSGGALTVTKVKMRLSYWFRQTGSTFDNGSITYTDIDARVYNLKGSTPPSTFIIPYNKPALTVNPPVSGTPYQNTNTYDILIYLPVYTSTSGTAGNVKASIGPTSTPATQVVNDIVNSGTSSTNPRTIILKVPAGWYYEFTGTTATFGTAIVVAD